MWLSMAEWTGYVAGLGIPRGYPSVGGKDGSFAG